MKATHKDVLPPTNVAHKVQPMLPQIVVRRALHLDIEKKKAVRAWMARGAHAQSEEVMILTSQCVNCELAK